MPDSILSKISDSLRSTFQLYKQVNDTRDLTDRYVMSAPDEIAQDILKPMEDLISRVSELYAKAAVAKSHAMEEQEGRHLFADRMANFSIIQQPKWLSRLVASDKESMKLIVEEARNSPEIIETVLLESDWFIEYLSKNDEIARRLLAHIAADRGRARRLWPKSG